MKRIPILFALVDDEDFDRISAYTWSIHVGNRMLYVSARVNGQTVFMHRLILGAQAGQIVDHKNRNGLDNQRDNIRFATVSQNNANSIGRKGKTSKYKGVTFNSQRQKWYAQIKKNGHQKHLGTFETEIEAARAYDTAAREVHGKFARTNF